MAEIGTRHAEFQTAEERRQAAESSGPSRRMPRFVVFGAGQRGTAYAAPIVNQKMHGVIAAVAEPLETRRKNFGKAFVWQDGEPREDQEFDNWRDFIGYETKRRELEQAGERTFPGVDGVFICTLDHTHREIIEAVAPLKLHVMCEKPLAATLEDCTAIWKSLTGGGNRSPEVLFSIGHVLRYSPHNILLRKLLLEEKVIGEVLSIEHTEPVGWWHYAHSYVRGNWRKAAFAAPSLLTKSCHDIDLILWLLAYRSEAKTPSHMPSLISSMGDTTYFTRRRKPKAAGDATNCLSCPHEPDCNYSAKKIYLGKFDKGIYGWPNQILVPDLEDFVQKGGVEHGRELVKKVISEDYDSSTPEAKVESKPWYGRCVWESDNDVCDDQTVTFQWFDGSTKGSSEYREGMGPKIAIFHMASNTLAQCERRGKIAGTTGEIEYDSYEIKINDFTTGTTRSFTPLRPGGGHGGGDAGLAGQFVQAVDQVVNGQSTVEQAQTKYMGCNFEEAFMSHVMVFAGEEARKQRRSLDWPEYWDNVRAGSA